ncbi:hypothetical protein [Streptomyces xylophagus]|uniref:hypothetical protein n=1 Tax=Streptomyces xylophagus TaxID=285514 RepID=UPI00068B333D|nr:hypothetical protein [Streptomyces xylophagus]
MGGDNGDRGDVQGIEREYRKRRKVPRGWLFSLGGLTLYFLSSITRRDSTPGWARLLMFAFLLAVIARGVLYMHRGRTLVDTRGVTARRALTERRRSWHDIYDIRVQPIPKAPSYVRKWLVHLYDNDGRRFLLPHVDDWQLDDPPAEVEELRAVAARHRGMAWEARPAIEARIRERAAHRKAWERAVIGALIVFGCTFLLALVLIVTTDEPPLLLLLLWIPLAAFALFAPFFHWRASRAPAHP